MCLVLLSTIDSARGDSPIDSKLADESLGQGTIWNHQCRHCFDSIEYIWGKRLGIYELCDRADKSLDRTSADIQSILPYSIWQRIDEHNGCELACPSRSVLEANDSMQDVDKKNILNWVAPGDKSGEFKRQVSSFRNFISREPGAEFPPEKDRYHLYVSYACPWAHRTLIVRKLKGLEDMISFTSVHWHMQEKGWRFATADEKLPGENVTPDPLHEGFTHLRQIYFEQNPDYSGRFTVPTLYDKKQKKIVSNESAEIIRMLYYEFDDLLPEEYKKIDLFPEELRKEIESTNEWTYNDVNNGVYKSGFAT